MISYEDFAKLDLKTAEIKTAEKVENSNKLLKITIDIGGGEIKQIISGIAKYFTPEELIGKKIVVLINLEPKIINGLESQGMLLAASDKENGISLIIPEKTVPSGTKVY